MRASVSMGEVVIATAALAILVCLPGHGSGVLMPLGVRKEGIAKHYDPQRMEATARYRGLTLPEGYAGFASVQECDHGGRKDAFMGRTVWASIASGPYLRYMVADCSHPRDRQRHRDSGLVIEIGYEQAKAQGWANDRQRPAKVWGYEE